MVKNVLKLGSKGNPADQGLFHSQRRFRLQHCLSSPQPVFAQL
jgi:hypothetical protein